MSSRPRTRRLAAAAAGAAAAVLGAGLGELVAALLAPESSPFSVVGGALIDAAPTWAKDTAIAWFGTADKVALLTGIALVLLVVAGAAGVLERRFAPWGALVLLALGAGAAVVAATRTGAGPLAWLPAIVAGLTAAITLRLLVRALSRAEAAGSIAEHAEAERADAAAAVTASSGASGHTTPADTVDHETGREPGAVDRRGFFAWTGGAVAAGVLALVVANIARSGSRVVTAVREAVRLPAPTRAAAAVPAGAELGLTGLAPVVTPNDVFYRIDTALIVPQVDPADWRLRIHGMVAREIELTWDELLALPLEESWTTLACVSNPVGGDLIGNARWLGHPVRELLARAQPDADADMVLSRSIDGFTASTPLEALTDERDAILAVGMNGEPLPPEHGFPVRLVVPGLYGYVSATKWVVDLEVTRFDVAQAYWTTRGWSERGPIKLQSRIDVPRHGARLEAGDTTIAGVAWQQHVGIAKVEVQVDGGPWREATLASAISDDTWVQWSIPWNAERGSHRIRCRATNADGETQTAAVAPPAPDGATGWPQRAVEVA